MTENILKSWMRLITLLVFILLVACSRGTADPDVSPSVGFDDVSVASATVPAPDPAKTATSEEPAPQPTASPSETEEAEDIYFAYQPPPTSPADFAGLIAQQVETGLWTQEAGLLLVLRAYAGDPEAAGELALYPPPLSNDMHRLFFQVRQYIKSGANSEVRDELARLMQTIAPDAATLDAYSVREDAQTAKPLGLAVRSEMQPSAVCQDLADRGFPKGEAVTCFLYSSFTLAGKEYRVYYPASWGKGGGEKAPQVQAVFVALSDAITRYAQFGPQNGVNIVFAIKDAPQESGNPNLGSIGADADAGDPCPVVIYPFGASYDLNELKFLVAHEVFHCFQWRHYEALMGIDGRDWWVEGGAEYFANLVYPAADYEHADWLSLFVSGSRFTPVVAMSYESYLFFMYLGMRDDFGPIGVLSLMGVMPPSGGVKEQAAALAGYPGMQQIWRDFGHAFVDNKILDTSGKFVQTDFLPNQALAVLDDEIFSLESDDFTLARYRVSLGPGQGFKVDVSQGDPAVQYELRHLASPGVWGEFSLDLPAGCAQYYGLLTSVGVNFTQGDNHKSEVEAQVAAPAITGGTCDQCIVGTWKLNNESYLAAIDAILESSAGNLINYNAVSGSAKYSFSSAGSLQAEFSDLTYEFSGLQKNAPFGNDIDFDTRLTINGADDALYWTDGASGLYLVAADFSLDYRMQTWLNGDLVYDGPALDDLSVPAGAQAINAYSCSANELKILILPATVHMGPLVYNRAP